MGGCDPPININSVNSMYDTAVLFPLWREVEVRKIPSRLANVAVFMTSSFPSSLSARNDGASRVHFDGGILGKYVTRLPTAAGTAWSAGMGHAPKKGQRGGVATTYDVPRRK